ncbi:MAG: S8 family serine peptidase, partial [Planctomycetota bacterium]|nr:S8 family serine peptidase [Planctomycetota bacterium]
MTTTRHWWAMLTIFVSMLLSLETIKAQDFSTLPPYSSETLYLQVGNIETNRLENLLVLEEPTFPSNRVRVLVLDRPMDEEVAGRLDEIGVRPLDYLPSHAFTVRLEGVDRAELSRVPGVIRVVDYYDAWKLQPGIVERLGTHQQRVRRELDRMGMLALIVSLHPGEDVGQSILQIRQSGATVELVERVGTHDELSVIATPDQLVALSSIGSILFIEDAPDIRYRNGTTRWIIQTNVTNQVPVYDNGIHGEGQIIGVLDGRVDQSHCSFSGGKIVAYNSTAGADSHGTHVAGTAAGNNGLDNDTRGIAYEASLVTNTVPAFTEAGIVGRLNLHHGQGARIHTNSWGNDGTTAYDSLSRGFDVFLRDNEESFVCLAVTNGAVLRNPENAKNLLAIGASQDTPSEASHCSGGVGPTSDGRRKPEVYAPGCSTLSSQAATACSVTASTGTSMACPAVSGAAALIRQYYVNGYYPSGSANPADAMTPSGALIKATLINSATDMTGVAGYPSNLEGWGRARIGDPLFFTGDSRTLGVLEDVRNASGMSSGQQATYNVNVINSGESLRITLVWTDVAATAGAGVAPVNDLDLEVTSPSGPLFLGNVFTGGFSSTGGTRDSINNVEQVHIQTPESGSWSVRIRGTAVNSGTQGYSVLVTGGIQLAPPDCNANGIPDATDITSGTSTDCDGNTVPDECQEDCNLNGVADSCDITAGTSADCDGNLTPDECQPDCNGNGAADSCEISGGLEFDCDGNGVPDVCDISAGAIDCDSDGVIDSCQIAAGATDCNLNGALDGCDISGAVSADCNGNGTPDECDAVSVISYSSSPAAPVPPLVSDNIVVAESGVILDVDVQVNITHAFVGDLVVDLTSPAATIVRLQNELGGSALDLITTFDDDGLGTVPTQPLSGFDGQSKQGTWNLTVDDVFPAADSGVVNSWALVIEAQGTGFTDCNSNGVDDACDVSSGTTPDCNGNGTPDSCDIASGTSVDANGNGTPDECDSADCNGNGVADDQDIASGSSADCNGNATPDECDIIAGAADCDGDGSIDSCELISGTGLDCNGNGTLDHCDIA